MSVMKRRKNSDHINFNVFAEHSHAPVATNLHLEECKKKKFEKWFISRLLDISTYLVYSYCTKTISLTQ